MDMAGHRIDDPHDCFLMQCRRLGDEVRSLRAALAESVDPLLEGYWEKAYWRMVEAMIKTFPTVMDDMLTKNNLPMVRETLYGNTLAVGGPAEDAPPGLVVGESGSER